MERTLPWLGIASAALAGLGVIFVPDGSGLLFLFPVMLFAGAVLVLLDHRGRASVGFAVVLILLAFVSLLAYSDITVKNTSLSWAHNNLGPQFIVGGGIALSFATMVQRWERLDPQWFVVAMTGVHAFAYALIMAVPRAAIGVPFAENVTSLVPAALAAYACAVPGITVLARGKRSKR